MTPAARRRSLMRLRLRLRIARSRMRAGVGRSSIVWMDAWCDFSMPIENERKFVLDDDGELEAAACANARCDQEPVAPGLSRRVRACASAPSRAAGTKRHVFTFKRRGRWPGGRDRDRHQSCRFRPPVVANAARRCRRRATRGPTARFHWDVDFFKTDEGRTYFRPGRSRDAGTRHGAAAACHRHWRGICWRWPRPAICASPRKRLADRAHAERMLAEIRTKGKIE